MNSSRSFLTISLAFLAISSVLLLSDLPVSTAQSSSTTVRFQGAAYIDSNCSIPFYDLTSADFYVSSRSCQSWNNYFSLMFYCYQNSSYTDVEVSYYTTGNCPAANVTVSFNFQAAGGPNACIPGVLYAGGQSVTVYAKGLCNATTSLPPVPSISSIPVVPTNPTYSNATMTVYNDATCSGSSSGSSAYAYPYFSPSCISLLGYSYIFNCQQNSSHTDFLFAYYNNSGCSSSGSALVESIHFVGGGASSCLAGTIQVQGFSTPIYGKITCYINGNYTLPSLPSTGIPHFSTGQPQPTGGMIQGSSTGNNNPSASPATSTGTGSPFINGSSAGFTNETHVNSASVNIHSLHLVAVTSLIGMAALLLF